MAYLRFTLWISLLFYDFKFLTAADSIHGQQITLQALENLQSLTELEFDETLRLEKIIVKRNADEQPSSPQIFKFELDDAKEPDEETKKLIQMRARELRLIEQEANTTDTSKRSKRSAQKVKPQLIPFLITDAKEPDNATKELIRRSRAKELSLVANKEPSIRQSRHKDENSEFSTQKREPSKRQSRGKNFASIASNKEPLRQGRVKSIALTPDDRREPIRQGKVQSVPLTTTITDQESLRVNRATLTATQKRQRSSKKSSRKRTRRFAQLTEPRMIKFELQDVKKSSGSDNRASEVQILPHPVFGAKIPNQTPEFNTSQYSDSDSSVQDSKYRYFIQQAPRKPHYGLYPKRYGNDLVFRVNKMQKYIASGQGLENINTNIEITLPPAVTANAIVTGYPKHVYGQKLCPYGNQGCQVGPLAPRANAVHDTQQEEFNKHSQNLIAENEVLPERQAQRYYYNFYTHPQQEVNQQYIPLVKPYQAVAQIAQTPLVDHQQPLHPQEPQVAQQIHVVDNKLTEQNPLLQLAYLEPTYGYGNKLYPYGVAKNNLAKPANDDQNGIGQFDGGRNQEAHHQSQIYEDQARKLDLLKNNPEFQELSVLIGKSPMDQVHGLSYLLAKEMQRQKSTSTQQRPQDQTSPILFHPKENTSITNSQSAASVASAVVQTQHFEDPKVESNQVTPFRPLRQLNKNIPPPTVQSVQIVHPVHNVQPVQLVQHVQHVQPIQPVQPVQHVQPVDTVQSVQLVQHVEQIQPVHSVQPVQHVQPIQPVQLVQPVQPVQPVHPVQPVQLVHPVQQELKEQINSGDDGKELGLSPNYNGVDSYNYLTQKIYPQTENDAPLEYASKYSFGYRVRDVHSGNDFFHKQNRDEDGVTRGQYQILMPDGRMQNVVYYADDTGFHADVSY